MSVRALIVGGGLVLGLSLNGCSQLGSWDMLKNLGDLGSKRMKIVFDNSLQSNDLHDFPVLVMLDPVRTDNYIGFKTDGMDIRFIDPEHPAVLLDHDNPGFTGTAHCRDVVSYKAASFGALNGGQWYYLVGVYNSHSPKLQAFKDGIMQNQNFSIGSPLSAMLWHVFIGTSENTLKVLDGVIDEVRICDQFRSEDWIHAQYLSMTDSSISYGVIEDL